MPTGLEDKDAIRELFAKYCFYTDSGQLEKYVNLFTEDCDWDGGAFGHHQGRAPLLAALQSMRDVSTKMRHHNCNIVIKVDGDDARATSYVTVYNVGEDTPTVFFVGCYIDHLVRQNGQWLFKQRIIRTDLSEAEHL